MIIGGRALSLDPPPRCEAGEARHLLVTRVAHRKLDSDNLVAGLKGIIDTLVEMRLFVDDSPEWLSLDYEQRRPTKGEDPYTLLTFFRRDA